MRALRRILRPAMVAEYNRALSAAADQFQPEMLFVFKGESVAPETLRKIKSGGAIAINFYPDTGFEGHGSYLRTTVGLFDWMFTTKPSHLAYLKSAFAYEDATFVTHAFDPEIHHPVEPGSADLKRYLCDVSFIGNISAKKQRMIEHVRHALPDVDLRIWGAPGWHAAHARIGPVYQGAPVWAQEYAKAIRASKINLCILFEGTADAPSGDVITARTFEIPAAGGFLLHERTDEALRHFEDGAECGYFDDPDDLVAKIRYYLAHEAERRAIAEAGHLRALSSGCSYDDRAAQVVAKYHELRRKTADESRA